MPISDEEVRRLMIRLADALGERGVPFDAINYHGNQVDVRIRTVDLEATVEALDG